MNEAAFVSLAKELRNLVTMTSICYGKHGKDLMNVKRHFMFFNRVIECGDEYGIAKEAFVVANAVMDGVLALCDAGRSPDFGIDAPLNLRRAVAIMIQLTLERLSIIDTPDIDVVATICRFKDLEDELRLACFGSFAFGDIEAVIKALRYYTLC